MTAFWTLIWSLIVVVLKINIGGGMDKYSKMILTVIAVGILGLNYHMINGKIISEAKAASESVQKVVICNVTGIDCVAVGRLNAGYNALMIAESN